MAAITSRADRDAQASASNIGRLSDDHAIIAICQARAAAAAAKFQICLMTWEVRRFTLLFRTGGDNMMTLFTNSDAHP
ncbi:hypothetical protein KFQ04_26345 [Pseudomonas synxantha]|nr:hypothetical protein KFQ04_26345 [Pseudomonas synxantha]